MRVGSHGEDPVRLGILEFLLSHQLPALRGQKNETEEGSCLPPVRRKPHPLSCPLMPSLQCCDVKAWGTVITYPPSTRYFPSFIYYYVPPFLCRRQPYVNFIPLSNGLGYTTNNSKKENLY